MHPFYPLKTEKKLKCVLVFSKSRRCTWNKWANVRQLFLKSMTQIAHTTTAPGCLVI